MRLRHACASFLVGWFLIVPPIVGQSPKLQVESGAPASKWEIVDEYASLSGCERDRGMWKSERTWKILTHRSNAHPPKREAFAESLCIPSDDPKLNGNQDIKYFKTGHWQPEEDSTNSAER